MVFAAYKSQNTKSKIIVEHAGISPSCAFQPLPTAWKTFAIDLVHTMKCVRHLKLRDFRTTVALNAGVQNTGLCRNNTFCFDCTLFIVQAAIYFRTFFSSDLTKSRSFMHITEKRRKQEQRQYSGCSQPIHLETHNPVSVREKE